jgi:hypothetical protein
MGHYFRAELFMKAVDVELLGRLLLIPDARPHSARIAMPFRAALNCRLFRLGFRKHVERAFGRAEHQISAPVFIARKGADVDGRVGTLWFEGFLSHIVSELLSAHSHGIKRRLMVMAIG